MRATLTIAFGLALGTLVVLIAKRTGVDPAWLSIAALPIAFVSFRAFRRYLPP